MLVIKLVCVRDFDREVRQLRQGRYRGQPSMRIRRRGGGDALSGGQGAAFRGKLGSCGTPDVGFERQSGTL